jgi:hypothetical protein
VFQEFIGASREINECSREIDSCVFRSKRVITTILFLKYQQAYGAEIIDNIIYNYYYTSNEDNKSQKSLKVLI